MRAQALTSGAVAGDFDGQDSIRRRASSILPDSERDLRVELWSLYLLGAVGDRVAVMLVETVILVDREMAGITISPDSTCELLGITDSGSYYKSLQTE